VTLKNKPTKRIL